MARPFAAFDLVVGRLILTALAAPLLAGCVAEQPTPRRTGLAADRVELPTSRQDGFLFVDARVNGAGPFRFLVDTGTSWLVLSDDVVKAAGIDLQSVDGANFSSPVGDIKTHFAVVHRVEFPGFALTDLVAAVPDNSDLAPIRRRFRHFDGIVGMAVFNDVILEMNFPTGRVSVIRPGAGSYPAKDAVDYTGVIPTVTMEVADRRVPAVVDTGSGFTLIVPDLVQYRLEGAALGDDGIGGFAIVSVNGTRKQNGQLAGAARLGPVTWINPPLRSQPHGQPGNIGNLALATWTLAIDQQTHHLYFLGDDLVRAWPKEPPPDLRLRPGYFANIQGDGLRLVEVDGGSAIDLAGLRVGDVILSIDGVPAAKFTHWNGTRKLRVQRGDLQFEATAKFMPGG